MAEDEIEDLNPSLGDEHNPFENKQVDEKIIPVGGLYQNWFLDYASYVILERAVPALNDGLKPVQRRILHSMRELEDGRYNKVANIIGNTMKYHPHGDASIGDALVQLGQKDLLIDCQGNWGNTLTGDGAAAARYIEARLSKFALHVAFNPKTTNWLPSSIVTSALNSHTSDFRIAEFQHVLSTDERDKQAAEADMKALLATIERESKEYQPLISSDEERAIWQRFEKAWSSSLALNRRLVELSRSNQSEEARALLRGESQKMFDEGSNRLLELVDLNTQGGHDASAAADQLYASSRIALIVASAIAVALAVVAAALAAVLLVVGLAFGAGSLVGARFAAASPSGKLAAWSEDWVGVRHKAVLSASAFCGAVHMHGGKDSRLLADLDCNGWPQKGRDEALRAAREEVAERVQRQVARDEHEVVRRDRGAAPGCAFQADRGGGRPHLRNPVPAGCAGRGGDGQDRQARHCRSGRANWHYAPPHPPR